MKLAGCLVSGVVVAMKASSVSAYNVYVDVPNTRTCSGARIVTKNVVGICDITNHTNSTDGEGGDVDGCKSGDTVQITGDSEFCAALMYNVRLCYM